MSMIDIPCRCLSEVCSVLYLPSLYILFVSIYIVFFKLPYLPTEQATNDTNVPESMKVMSRWWSDWGGTQKNLPALEPAVCQQCMIFADAI